MALIVPMDLKQTIGWNLRQLRVTRGLSQERLALESGIDRAYVGRVERGEENVTVNTLEAFSRALGVHASALFVEIAGDATPPPVLRAGRKRKPD